MKNEFFGLESLSRETSSFSRRAPRKAISYGKAWRYLRYIFGCYTVSMKIINALLQEIKNGANECTARFTSVPDKVSHDILYVCQFATPEHAELSLKKKLNPVDDPYWESTGAISPERYSDWAFTMCGMASTSMALSHFHNKNIKPVLLAEDALRAGVYTENAKEISGMKYREFVEWVAKYDLSASVYTRLSVCGIQYALSKGGLVIVSVNPNIRGYNTASPNQKGGHLVLVTGYDRNKKTVSINNPSGFVSGNTQINHELSHKEFLSYFAGRGIVVRK